MFLSAAPSPPTPCFPCRNVDELQPEPSQLVTEHIMKKLSIVGASHFVNRMFEACGNYQWAREFLKNAVEASASKIEFGIEWQAVERFGIYRRAVSDNGIGMNRDELLLFFSTLGEGAKRIGGIHDNFGVGA